MAKASARNLMVEQPDGAVRESQVVTTYGPGSLVDLVDHAVLIGGADYWAYDKKQGGAQSIFLPRLRDSLAERFRKLERNLRESAAFLHPPAGDDRGATKRHGVQVLEFPRWFICQSESCRALVRADGLELKRGRYVHACPDRSSKNPVDCVPVRFVAACKNGHLDEFPWINFAHDGPGCASPDLQLLEGATGDFAEIVIRCRACKARRQLIAATIPENVPVCRGTRPWLGDEAREECKDKMRMLVRTASNGYFSLVASALSIPEQGMGLREAVQEQWGTLQVATKETLPVFLQVPDVKKALEGFGATDILATIEAIKAGRPAIRDPLRVAEYRQLCASPPDAMGGHPPADADFFARTIEPAGLPHGIAQVVAVKKLREVRVQVGFTRIEAPTADLQGEFDLGVGTQPLGLDTDWLPGSEIWGEGLFIRLDEAAVQAWEARQAVIDHDHTLNAGYAAHHAGRDNAPEFLGARFYLLHSLAHLLMTSLSIACGYPSSSIRERIYCAPASDALPMAGLLLSTGSPGAEGTLGGLVEEGRNLGQHLKNALDRARLCSNDPVCAHHTPGEDPSERFLEGAACHGCLFVAECSCERFNRYLDRALVVPVLGTEDVAFFE